ncbi:hypothetical protein ACFVXG_43150 [Kitasatospora sp. NPDC058162]|uniref:hypothetical protein n=1 Tax=Kitasatospora sp. NPDC058162 TaxID=3346362 RepID=UPI0036DB67DB
MTQPLFHACADPAEYRDRARDRAERPSAPVPLLTAGRPDLAAAAAYAAPLYAPGRIPPCSEIGLLLPPAAATGRPGPAGDPGSTGRPGSTGESGEPDGHEQLSPLLRPLARRWVHTAEEVPSSAGSVLVVGTYPRLRHDELSPLLRPGGPDRSLTLLTGRDLPSLSWMLAKQYVDVRPEVVGRALFSDTDAPPGGGRGEVFAGAALRADGLRDALAGRPWRRVMVQGHGGDDHVNLGTWTLCGRAAADVSSGPVRTRPRCGHGHPCFKPVDRLVGPGEVLTAEIVLSSCANGPFADTASYDSRFQVMLAAIDGPAQSVVAAPGVHDSDRPENLVYLAHERPGGLAGPLNRSLADVTPGPVYLQYGFPTAPGDGAVEPSAPRPRAAGRSAHGADRPAPPAEALSAEQLAAPLDRAVAYLSGGLLPPRHPLRPRLERFAGKYLALLTRAGRPYPPAVAEGLRGDLQSLDHAIAGQLRRDPQDPLAQYPEYWARRSRIVGEPEAVSCVCGLEATRTVLGGLARIVPDTESVLCPRCGDVAVRPTGAPRVRADGPGTMRAGEEAELTVGLSAGRAGAPVQLGVFFPPFLRDACAVEPPGSRVRLSPAGAHTVRFVLRVAPDALPQMHYCRVFAVQDLAVSGARAQFPVVPART